MIIVNVLAKIAINTLLGVTLIFIWLHFVDIKSIFTTISQVNLMKLLPVVIFMLISPSIRALRLKIFLAPIKKTHFLDLIFLNGVATMLNFLIPIRGGEIAKGIYLHTSYHLPFGKSLVWIFLDRFIDFLAVLILVAVLLFLIPTSLSISFIIIITIIFFISLFLTFLMVYQSNFAKKLFSFLRYLLIINTIKIYFYRISVYLMNSFSVLKRGPRDILALFSLTVLAYGADAAIWYFTFLAIGSHQEYLKMYLGQLLSALTYLVPAAPGYVGSAEASGLLIFSGVFGVSTNLASAMIVLFHVLTALFVISFGVISIYFLKIDLGMILSQILKKNK
ncbi:flippase-like domain-containing protein [Candidatus Daviesbacteria bacterium]|nr:flippase-like domain-containing protein [Candidatus Daviesbacteria bacterium]